MSSEEDKFIAGVVIVFVLFVVMLFGAFLQDVVFGAEEHKNDICKAVNAKAEGNVCIRDGKVVYRIP